MATGTLELSPPQTEPPQTEPEPPKVRTIPYSTHRILHALACLACVAVAGWVGGFYRAGDQADPNLAVLFVAWVGVSTLALSLLLALGPTALGRYVPPERTWAALVGVRYRLFRRPVPVGRVESPLERRVKPETNRLALWAVALPASLVVPGFGIVVLLAGVFLLLEAATIRYTRPGPWRQTLREVVARWENVGLLYGAFALALVGYAAAVNVFAALFLALLLTAVGFIGWKRYHENLAGSAGATPGASAGPGSRTHRLGQSLTTWQCIAVVSVIVATGLAGWAWSAGPEAGVLVALGLAAVGFLGWKCYREQRQAAEAPPPVPAAPPPASEFKTCPHCAEVIRSEAVLCRFCQKEVSGEPVPAVSTPATQPPVATASPNYPGIDLGQILAGVGVFIVLIGGINFFRGKGSSNPPAKQEEKAPSLSAGQLPTQYVSNPPPAQTSPVGNQQLGGHQSAAYQRGYAEGLRGVREWLSAKFANGSDGIRTQEEADMFTDLERIANDTGLSLPYPKGSGELQDYIRGHKEAFEK